MTVEMVNDAGGPKLRGSIALCSMTGGNAATSASEAHVIHPTVVSDGSPHDFIFEKGSPGTNLAPGCVSVNVDSGTAEEALVALGGVEFSLPSFDADFASSLPIRLQTGTGVLLAGLRSCR